MNDDEVPEGFDPHVGETIDQRRLRLVAQHGLIEDTGEWGEVVDPDLEHLAENPEIRNPEENSTSIELSRNEKKLAAIRMKRSGASYPRIAEALGFSSPATARNLVRQTMDEALQENVDELRKIHYNRLEEMLGVFWDRAIKGDPMAFDKVGNTMDRIERLYGLSAPNRTETTHTTRESIVIAEGDKATYLAVLEQVGRQRELEEMGGVVDAEVIEDD